MLSDGGTGACATFSPALATTAAAAWPAGAAELLTGIEGASSRCRTRQAGDDGLADLCMHWLDSEAATDADHGRAARQRLGIVQPIEIDEMVRPVMLWRISVVRCRSTACA